MKLSSKPISSPGRTEKFPPPLMRFLRSNGGSRSRGRSRSSPMFVRKKNASIETTQEPTSPKVTCMGQVRVKRSKQTARKNGRTVTITKKRCSWIQKSLFCNCFTQKSNPKSSHPVWRSWFLCSQNGYRKKVEIIEDSAKIESKSDREEEEEEEEEEKEEVEEEEEEEEEKERENKGFVSSSSPPKNALLLMRCRSDPCRNSSVLNRFWGSPSTTEDSSEQKNRAQIENKEEEEENEKPILKNEPICIDSTSISRPDLESEEKIGFCESSSSASSTSKTSKIKDEEERKVSGGVEEGTPLTLTRCKSEPARRSMKVDSDTYFWKKRKSERISITEHQYFRERKERLKKPW